MTAAPHATPSITTRPMEPDDRAYVSSTAVDTAVWDHGGRLADRREIRHLADDLIDHSRVTIATFSDEPSILGYVARDPVDATVELLYLRLSLVDDIKGIQWRNRAAKEPKTSPAERAHLEEYVASEMRVAVLVAQALLPDTEVVFRRRPPFLALEAVTRGGFLPVVRPRAL